MKVGELYETARMYLPGINTTIFTMFYNQALEKLSYDLNIAERTDTFTGDDVEDVPLFATKILKVYYNGTELARLVGV